MPALLATRRSALLLPLFAAACASGGPVRTSFPPLRYDYLPPLRLNVASIEYAPLPPGNALDASDPVPLGPALQLLAQDRLAVGGSSGTALVTVKEARLVRLGAGLDGAAALQVDIMAADGTRAGFAEARVTRTTTGIGNDLRAALYDVTKQLLDDMNVELEFQLRRSLKDYMQSTETAPPPAAVQQQDLAAPPARAP